ncbi:MAG TPA: DUF3592 domain-containing protein [Gemmatales bacterium]|nr:DUF3592 domain-containing protein [Gemmatales bacterium]HMP57958.1 DUF3592 domain-containing protein [Gemmatales bacterium]
MRFLALGMMLVCTLSGLMILGVSLREGVLRLWRRRRLVRAEGVIVYVVKKTFRRMPQSKPHLRPLILNFPLVQFRTREGDEIKFTSETGDTGPQSRYVAGERLAVLYDPEGKLPPTLATVSGQWLPSLIGVLAGCIFLSVTLLIYCSFWERIVSH